MVVVALVVCRSSLSSSRCPKLIVSGVPKSVVKIEVVNDRPGYEVALVDSCLECRD